VEPTEPTPTTNEAPVVPDGTETPGELDASDIDAIERDLDEVERTLDRLADRTYWSDDDHTHGAQVDTVDRPPRPADGGAAQDADEQPDAPA
jgi:hypothetical protein